MLSAVCSTSRALSLCLWGRCADFCRDQPRSLVVTRLWLRKCQILKSIHVRARRAVELGDGGFVVGFMLEDDACESPDHSPAMGTSPAPSYSASTEVGAQGSSSSVIKPMSRSLSSDRDLHMLRACAARCADRSDSPEIVEIYDARKDCLQRPSGLGVAYKPAGVWLHRMRLLRQRGFTVLQVGTEQWAGLVRVDEGDAASDAGELAHAARSGRAEWLMKLIDNTAAWARTLTPMRYGALPRAASSACSGGLDLRQAEQLLDVAVASERKGKASGQESGSNVSSASAMQMPLSPRDSLGDMIDAVGDADSEVLSVEVEADGFRVGESAASVPARKGGMATCAGNERRVAEEGTDKDTAVNPTTHEPKLTHGV